MMRFSTYLLVSLSIVGVLAFVPTASAVDGVVLINQASSTNGLPGCPHTGFPIIICKSGSYRLSGNLTVTAVNVDAIDINADNVTIDLNGFTISGPSICTLATYPVQCTNVGTGIGIFSHANFQTANNGTVEGFGGGVIFTSTGALIDRVRAEFNSNINSSGLQVFDGVIIHCVANANAGNGIAGGVATVSSSSVTYNGAYGIVGGATVNNNSVLYNGQDGIHGALNVDHNTAWGNIGWGIVMTSPDAAYQGNIVAGNGFGAIFGGASLGQNLCNGGGC